MSKRKLSRISYGIVGLLLLLGFSSFVLPGHAYTNSFTGIGNSSCTNPCANPVTVAGTIATANDILVMVVQCETPNAVLSITDTNAGGWASANARTIPTQTGTGNPDGATSHANTANAMAAIWSSSAEAAGAVTVTVTFTQSNLYCVETLLEANTPSVAVNTGAFSIQQFSEPSSSANSVLSTVTVNYPTAPANSLVLFFAGGIGVNNNHAMNGVTVNGPASTVTGSSSALGQTFISSSGQVNNDATYNHYCCGGVGNYDTDWLMSVVFAQQGTLPGKPASSYILGCTTAGTGTSKLTGNTTVYYPVWGTTTNQASAMSNVTVDVSSVALTNGQTSAFLQVGEYFSTSSTPPGQGPSQPNGNWLLAGNQIIILTNSAVAKNYTFNVQGSAPGTNGAAAIGVWVSHNGIFLRQAKAVSQNMYYDNGTSSYKTLTQFNAATKNACFGAKVSIGSSQQTFTFTTVQGTVTPTQTITVTSTVQTVDTAFLGSNPGNWILLVLLLFFPAGVLGAAMKGATGLLAGLTIGAIAASAAGIMPIYGLFLVGLVDLLLIFSMRRGE